jgi:hypothetical protein
MSGRLDSHLPFKLDARDADFQRECLLWPAKPDATLPSWSEGRDSRARNGGSSGPLAPRFVKSSSRRRLSKLPAEWSRQRRALGVGSPY